MCSSLPSIFFLRCANIIFITSLTLALFGCPLPFHSKPLQIVSVGHLVFQVIIISCLYVHILSYIIPENEAGLYNNDMHASFQALHIFITYTWRAFTSWLFPEEYAPCLSVPPACLLWYNSLKHTLIQLYSSYMYMHRTSCNVACEEVCWHYNIAAIWCTHIHILTCTLLSLCLFLCYAWMAGQTVWQLFFTVRCISFLLCQ